MPETPKTRHQIPAEFVEAADRFVQLANELDGKYPRDWVAATMLYAAARYAAFATLTSESSAAPTAPHATAYYTAEFEKMLKDNLDELAPVYRGASA